MAVRPGAKRPDGFLAIGSTGAGSPADAEDKDKRAPASFWPARAAPGSGPREPTGFYKAAVVCSAFVSAVFLLSSMKLIYVQEDHFRYPIFITALHQLFVMFVAGAWLRLTGRTPGTSEPQAGSTPAAQSEAATTSPQGARSGGPGRAGRPATSYWRRVFAIMSVVGPVAFFGATCVACANTALLYIYPSLHEMIQNLGPLWVIVVGKFVNPRRGHNLWTYLSMVPVFVGGALCINGNFGGISLLGVAASNLSAVMRAMRLAAQERIFEAAKAAPAAPAPPKAEVIGREEEEEGGAAAAAPGDLESRGGGGAGGAASSLEEVQKMDSVTLVYYTSPFNCLLFLLYSVIYEDLLSLRSEEPFAQGKVFRFLSLQLGGSTYFYIVFSGFVASVFTILAFLQVELVGGFICTMVSQLKTPAQIVVSWLIFGHPCTGQQLLGVAMVCAGLHAYNKYGKTTTAPAADAGSRQEARSS